MKLLIIFLLLASTGYGQTQLTWADFRGVPKPDHAANSNIRLSFAYTDLGDGHYMLDSIYAEFNPDLSYTNTSDSAILLHENQHFLIAYLEANYVNHLSHIKHIHYTYAEFKAMKAEVSRRWEKQDDRFDFETNHGINKEKEASWELWIAKQLILNK